MYINISSQATLISYYSQTTAACRGLVAAMGHLNAAWHGGAARRGAAPLLPPAAGAMGPAACCLLLVTLREIVTS